MVALAWRDDYDIAIIASFRGIGAGPQTVLDQIWKQVDVVSYHKLLGRHIVSA